MPPENDISPQDRDMMIRTIIGEAADQPPIGQAAVANVILNRLNAGRWGATPTQVVLAPNQFEPWSTRARDLAMIPRTSKIYQNVGGIVDKVVNGEIPDPTGGATHFLQEDIVRQRGTLPNWAQGQGLRIGAHTFFRPEENGVSAINNAIGAQPVRGQALAMNQETPDYLTEFLGSKQAPQATQASTPQTDYLSEFLTAKKAVPAPAVPTVESGSRVPVPQPEPPGYQPPALAQPGSEFMERTIKPLMNLPSGIATVAKDYGGRLQQLLEQNAATVGQGGKDIAAGKSATGVGEAGLGALGYLAAPLQAIDVPIGKMVGNKEFGEKAALLVPTSGFGKVANMARPTVNALTDVIKDIGQENIPQIIKRLESNPRLTLMDVAPTVRGNAAGLATDPRNAPAMQHLTGFQKERMAERPGATLGAFEDVLGPTPNVKQTITDLKAQAQKTGKEMIEPAIKSVKEINVAPIIKSIDDRIPSSMLADLKAGREPPAMPDEAKRLWNLRERLRGDAKEGPTILAVPEKVHNLQSELRLASGDPQIGFHARSVRRELVDAMDEASGGKYKAALKQYADDKSVDEAFRHGFEMFANPTSAEKSIANHPDMWKAWAEDASKAELDAVKKGIMIGARQRIMEMRKGNFIPEGGFTHERLSAIVGDKEANKIVKTLNDWRDIAETDNLLTKNSATAIRQAGQKAREVREVGPMHLQQMVPPIVAGAAAHMATGQPMLGGAALFGLAGLGKAARMVGKSHDVATNKAYAQWASATGQKKVDLINILRQAAAKSNAPSTAEKLLNLAPPSVLQALPR